MVCHARDKKERTAQAAHRIGDRLRFIRIIARIKKEGSYTVSSTSTPTGAKGSSGVERRKARRLKAKYSAFIRFVSPHGTDVERYAETRNVSAGGALLASTGVLPAGTQVQMQIGIPSAFPQSRAGAQLNIEAEVVRCERVGTTPENLFASRVALRFLGKPAIRSEITMFD